MLPLLLLGVGRREEGRLHRAFLSSWWSFLSFISKVLRATPIWNKGQSLCKALRASCITRAIWRQTKA